MNCAECFVLGVFCGSILAVAGCVVAFSLLWINRPRPDVPQPKDSVLE
jgi:hypothetical protein